MVVVVVVAHLFKQQRAPEEMKTSTLRAADPFHFLSASFCVSCRSSWLRCSVQAQKQTPPLVQVGRSNPKWLSAPAGDARTDGPTRTAAAATHSSLGSPLAPRCGMSLEKRDSFK